MKWKTAKKFDNYEDADKYRNELKEEYVFVKVKKYGGKQQRPIRFEVKIGENNK